MLLFSFVLLFILIMASSITTLSDAKSVEMLPLVIENEIQVPAAPEPTAFPLTSPCGARLATRVWVSSRLPKKLRGIVLCVHGRGWHSGYFSHLAKQIVNNVDGVLVAAYDQPSCGYSQDNPEAPSGQCTHIYEFADLVDEVYQAIEWCRLEASVHTNNRTTAAAIPVYLLGESFGGNQVLAAAMETRERKLYKIQGFICLGAALRVAPQLRPPPFVMKMMSWLAPYYAKTRLPLRNMETTIKEQDFGDVRWARVTKSDAKVARNLSFTLGAAVATLNQGEFLLQEAHKFQVPLLALHGRHDGRTQCKQSMNLLTVSMDSTKMPNLF